MREIPPSGLPAPGAGGLGTRCQSGGGRRAPPRSPRPPRAWDPEGARPAAGAAAGLQPPRFEVPSVTLLAAATLQVLCHISYPPLNTVAPCWRAFSPLFSQGPKTKPRSLVLGPTAPLAAFCKLMLDASFSSPHLFCFFPLPSLPFFRLSPLHRHPRPPIPACPGIMTWPGHLQILLTPIP